jgi:hypothetical protein
MWNSVLTAANIKVRAFCDIAPCSIEEVDRRFYLMMDAESTSDTSVYFYDITRRSISESSAMNLVK